MPQPSIQALLDSYPRSRPALNGAQREVLTSAYFENRRAESGVSRVVAFLESWMHRAVAAAGSGKAILEIGAGTLNHVRYESGYAVFDAIEPWTALYQGRPEVAKVRRFYADISEVPAENSYDKIVSIAVLEHLTDLPFQLARSGLLLAPGGIMAAGIPTEGSLSWGIAWRCGTGLLFRLKTGLDYGELMRHEHINSAREIELLIRYFYRDVQVRRFPLPVFHMSLYSVLIARKPDLDACRGVVDVYRRESPNAL